jgi:hypothetical protein
MLTFTLNILYKIQIDYAIQTNTSTLTMLVPDRRSRIHEVVIVRRLITWVLGIWRGEGLGRGLRKGRSVYKQPETKVDGSCHSKEGFQVSKGD